jgi:CBS domain-containing protein
MMQAIDVMVRDVVTVQAETDVADAIKILAEHDISALPVVDGQGQLVGIISEADLIHRVEIGTEKHRPWLLESLTGATTLAEDFAKSHGKMVGEIMTTDVVTATEDTSLAEMPGCSSAIASSACRSSAPAKWSAWSASPI